MRISQIPLFWALFHAWLFQGGAIGFSTGWPLPRRVTSSGVRLWLTPEEERAALLSDYLARAHEDKLKALRAIERSKDGEINALKEQLEQTLATAPAEAAAGADCTIPSVGAEVESLSKQELVNVVKSYQQFMSKYIVDAQKKKAAAVKAAEAAVSERYEARLEQLSGTAVEASAPTASEHAAAVHRHVQAALTSNPVPDVASPIEFSPAEVETAPGSTTIKSRGLYARRNAHLVAASAAGKSRWGSLELDRAVFLTNRGKRTNCEDMAELVTPEVKAAEHGLRNYGGVDRPTLAERVAMGAGAGSGTVNGSTEAISDTVLAVPAITSANEHLFQKRNVRIAAAAKAGKSRWGDMEVMRIQKSVASVFDSKAADIVAADHGLQPDQGVSLADRVNLGARLLGR